MKKRGLILLLVSALPWAYCWYFLHNISPLVGYEFGSAVLPAPLLYRVVGATALCLTVTGLGFSFFAFVHWLRKKSYV